jgi:predicted nucleic acid-binding protein
VGAPGERKGQESPPDRLKIFIDADVLIAGSASTTGAAHLVLRLAELGLLEAMSSGQVRIECERNLRSKLPAALPAFRILSEAACRWVEDPSPRAVGRLRGQADPKDLPILAAAVETGCTSLITFNVRDYHPRGNVIRIETPGQLIARLRGALARLAEAD